MNTLTKLKNDLTVFFRDHKCGCCWFNLETSEMEWTVKKLELIETVIKQQSLSIKLTEALSVQNHPLAIGKKLVEKSKVEIYKKTGDRKKRIKDTITDPKVWVIDIDEVSYWRDEDYDTCYLPAPTVRTLIDFLTYALSNNMRVEMPSTHTAYIIRVIDSFDQAMGSQEMREWSASWNKIDEKTV